MRDFFRDVLDRLRVFATPTVVTETRPTVVTEARPTVVTEASPAVVIEVRFNTRPPPYPQPLRGCQRALLCPMGPPRSSGGGGGWDSGGKDPRHESVGIFRYIFPICYE